MGLGLFGGGVGAALHLLRIGWDVVVTDLRDESDLAPSVARLRESPHANRLRFVLGRHEERDFTSAQLVVVNPAVPPGNEFVAAATAAGIPTTTEIGMFTAACRAEIVAVTGTAGKSTTVALLGECLRRARGDEAVHVGGNIGRSLLADLPRIEPGHVVVLELSSFQLHWLRRIGWRPRLGAVTNVAPNHLDWHGGFDAYVADKRGVVPGPGGTLVACADDEGAREIAAKARCDVVWTARDTEPPAPSCLWRGGELVARSADGERVVLSRADVLVLGDHALWNVATAAALAGCLGTDDRHVRDAVRAFEGLPHRLHVFDTLRGVVCVNDSKATTPDAAAMGLRAVPGPAWLFAGGYDKGLDPAPLVRAAAEHARAVVCFGTTREALARAVREGAPGVETLVAETLAEAVAASAPRARPGEVLLLSPGHASWDQFRNFEARGEAFVRLVRDALG